MRIKKKLSNSKKLCKLDAYFIKNRRSCLIQGQQVCSPRPEWAWKKTSNTTTPPSSTSSYQKKIPTMMNFSILSTRNTFNHTPPNRKPFSNFANTFRMTANNSHLLISKTENLPSKLLFGSNKNQNTLDACPLNSVNRLQVSYMLRINHEVEDAMRRTILSRLKAQLVIQSTSCSKGK